MTIAMRWRREATISAATVTAAVSGSAAGGTVSRFLPRERNPPESTRLVMSIDLIRIGNQMQIEHQEARG